MAATRKNDPTALKKSNNLNDLADAPAALANLIVSFGGILDISNDAEGMSIINLNAVNAGEFTGDGSGLTGITGFLPLAGGVLHGNLDMGNQEIINLGDIQDANLVESINIGNRTLNKTDGSIALNWGGSDIVASSDINGNDGFNLTAWLSLQFSGGGSITTDGNRHLTWVADSMDFSSVTTVTGLPFISPVSGTASNVALLNGSGGLSDSNQPFNMIGVLGGTGSTGNAGAGSISNLVALLDPISNPTINSNGRQLVDSTGSNAALDWSVAGTLSTPTVSIFQLGPAGLTLTVDIDTGASVWSSPQAMDFSSVTGGITLGDKSIIFDGGNGWIAKSTIGGVSLYTASGELNWLGSGGLTLNPGTGTAVGITPTGMVFPPATALEFDLGDNFQIAVDASGNGVVNGTSLKLNTTTFGAYNKSPVAQPAYIDDADASVSTLAVLTALITAYNDLATKFNALKNDVIAAEGWMAPFIP